MPATARHPKLYTHRRQVPAKPLTEAGARMPATSLPAFPPPGLCPQALTPFVPLKLPTQGPLPPAASMSEPGREQGIRLPQECQRAPDLPHPGPQDIDKQYVGFATLPNQVHRKSVKKGFDFTLMVAGEWAGLPGRVAWAISQPGSVIGASDLT